MYRLYGNIAGWKLLDRCITERDLIDYMIDFSNKYNFYDYLIIEHLDNTDYPYRRIFNKEEFDEMLLEYNTTKDIPDMSAIELKRQMLKGRKL